MTITSLPLATVNDWHALVSRFRGGFSQSGVSGFVTNVLLMTIVVVLLASIVYLIRRQVLEKRANLPHGLFIQLCVLHGLTSAQRRLLKRLAAYQDLPDPSMLFLEPRYFALHAGPLEAEREQLVQLRGRLFE